MDRLAMQQLVSTRSRFSCLHQQFYKTRALTAVSIQQQKATARNLGTFQQHNKCTKFPNSSTTTVSDYYRIWQNPSKSRISGHVGADHHSSVGHRMYSTAAAQKIDTFSPNSKSNPEILPQDFFPESSPLSPTTELSSVEVDSSIVRHAPVELSAEQRFLLNQVIKKKRSVFFTGSAGTGKSVLLRQLIHELKEIYSPGQVAVTASTGIAACNIGGCTLHSFAGVGLGKGTIEHLMKKLEGKGGQKARGRWRKVKVLIIDEISMIDGETFDKFEAIARKMKKNDLPFGGIQLIITGDFFQLPPVVNMIPLEPTPTPVSTVSRTRRAGGSSTTTIIKPASKSDMLGDDVVNDYGLFFDDSRSFNPPPPLEPHTGPETPQATLCFDAETWKSCIDCTLQLTEVFRQRDPMFVKMLNEMRHGKLSEETCDTFRSLNRTPEYPDDGIKATELFSLRYQVERANNMYLEQLPGPTYLYQPKDDGPLKHYMDKACPAPSNLQLKENAQVMLIKNLSPTLVNGSMGLIVGFKIEKTLDEDTHEVITSHFPIVRFQGEEDDIVIRPEEWKMELPNGVIMASRIQVPLILSWAISIHKSQGQTMNRVKVDMGRIFEAGQAYVALSRATSLAGLQVLNFQSRAVQAHERVGEFYNNLQTVRQLMEQEEAEQEAVRQEAVRKEAAKREAARQKASMRAKAMAGRPRKPRGQGFAE